MINSLHLFTGLYYYIYGMDNSFSLSKAIILPLQGVVALVKLFIQLPIISNTHKGLVQGHLQAPCCY